MKKLTIEQVKLNSMMLGYECLSNVYIKSSMKLLYKCPEGHIIEKSYNNLRAGRKCQICYKEFLQKSYEDVLEQRKNIKNKRDKKNLYWKNKLFEFLGNKCYRCGFEDIRALQIDHINGGGEKERNGKRTGRVKMYKTMIDDPAIFKKYQILCCNCNWIKRIEDNEINQHNYRVNCEDYR